MKRLRKTITYTKEEIEQYKILRLSVLLANAVFLDEAIEFLSRLKKRKDCRFERKKELSRVVSQIQSYNVLIGQISDEAIVNYFDDATQLLREKVLPRIESIRVHVRKACGWEKVDNVDFVADTYAILAMSDIAKQAYVVAREEAERLKLTIIFDNLVGKFKINEIRRSLYRVANMFLDAKAKALDINKYRVIQKMVNNIINTLYDGEVIDRVLEKAYKMNQDELIEYDKKKVS